MPTKINSKARNCNPTECPEYFKKNNGIYCGNCSYIRRPDHMGNLGLPRQYVVVLINQPCSLNSRDLENQLN